MLIIAYCATGCSSFEPIEMSPEQLRRNIVSGEVIYPGDKIWLRTKDQSEYEFRVSSISDGKVIGDQQEILVSQITDVEIKEFNGGQTLLLGAGILIGVVLAVGAAASSAGIPPAGF